MVTWQFHTQLRAVETLRLFSLLQRVRWDPGGTPHPGVAEWPRQTGQNTDKTKPSCLLGAVTTASAQNLEIFPKQRTI